MTRYACSDLHGHYDIFEKINEILQPGDIVEFLGDAIDRGPDSFKLMEAIYQHPQWKYYRGNHESMLCESLKEYLNTGDRYNMSYMMSLSNGASYRGQPAVFEILLNKGEDEMRKWVNIIENDMYLYSMFYNDRGFSIHLSHAGTSSPDFDTKHEERDLLWDRYHIYHDVLPQYKKNISVHGHTPITFIENTTSINGLDFYKKGKLDIDAGVYYTGMVYLVNLDTLTHNNIDYQIFKTSEELYGTK